MGYLLYPVASISNVVGIAGSDWAGQIGTLRESSGGGTEIYILSVTVLASTKNDLDNSRADFSRSRIYSLLTVFLLPYAIFISMVFGVVYINEYVNDFGLVESFIANVGILSGIIASVICVSLQVMLSVAEG